MDAAELSPDLLAGERELAIRHARNQVLIQLAIVAACIGFVMFVGIDQQVGLVIALGIMAAAGAVYDARWWIWLRDAGPADAYNRLQQRPEFEVVAERTRSKVVVPLLAVALWWWLRR